MTKIIFTILFLCISVLSYGQSETETFDMRESGKSVYPELILKIDTLEIKLDSISIKRIDPNWIEKIEVIKDKQLMKQYENADGIVLIYPKKKFWEKLLILYKPE